MKYIEISKQQKQTGKSYLDMIGYTLPEVVVTAKYPHEQRVLNTVNKARYSFNRPEFLRRLDYNDRRYIKTPYGGVSTHLMAYDGNYAYPMIQDINGTLHNYDQKYGDYWNRNPKENGDYIKFQTPGDARYFAEHYKKYWPMFFLGAFKDGKDMIYNYLPGFKGGFDSFANNIGQKVYIELKKNGWYTPQRYDNIMSQLSHESAYGTSNLARNYHNYGGRVARKGQKSYKGFGVWANDDDFVKDQIQYIKNRPEMWNAKDTLSYAKAGKKYKYFKADVNDYASQMRKQISARKAWNAAMNTWSYPKQVINTAITEPVDATRVAKPVMEIPVQIEQPRQQQPTTYIDPTLLFDQPEEIQQPQVEDNLYAQSVLPDVSGVMRSLLQSNGIYAPDETNFISGLDLPGAKEGKNPGIHIKPSHRGRFTQYLKSHPGMTAEKAKHSKSAAVRKMATFALNARKWNH